MVVVVVVIVRVVALVVDLIEIRMTFPLPTFEKVPFLITPFLAKDGIYEKPLTSCTNTFTTTSTCNITNLIMCVHHRSLYNTLTGKSGHRCRGLWIISR